MPKYQQVYEALEREIGTGRWREGDRLPSEAELVERFGVSRITVGRAMRDLQRAGVVERRAGSGTYVAERSESAGGSSFGLLIPDLGETEIFEPICQGMMASPQAREHALLWGSGAEGGGTKAERAWRLCRQYIDRGVAGVFFAPLELVPGKDETNERIVAAFDAAGIPVVLLDRPVVAFPEGGGHDLVGIDNRQAGYVMAEHLLGLGCRRLAFAAVANAAATVDAREAGYREALYRRGLPVDAGLVARLEAVDDGAVEAFLAAREPDGIVCANDRTAGRWMHALQRLGRAVPGDVRIVGIDDVEYAELLPVPLTTFRQPTRAIGAVALATLLERIARPAQPTRDVLLHGELVVRRSCGARVR